MNEIKYNIDIVMCIDCTESMRDILDSVKENALTYCNDVQKRFNRVGKNIYKTRVKVIAYRNFFIDGENSISQTNFLTLPEQYKEFNNFISILKPFGGDGENSSSLETIALAIKSKWNKKDEHRIGEYNRETIVIWSNNSGHKLELNINSKPSNYPSNIPKNFDEITDMWEGENFMSKKEKRLLIFAPDNTYPWTNIEKNWVNMIHYPSEAGKGLTSVDYQAILDTVAFSSPPI